MSAGGERDCLVPPGGKGRTAQRREADGIARPYVSHLMNGHFSRFTTGKLLDFLKRLDQKVTIHISPHKPGEPYQEVEFTT